MTYDQEVQAAMERLVAAWANLQQAFGPYGGLLPVCIIVLIVLALRFAPIWPRKRQ